MLNAIGVIIAAIIIYIWPSLWWVDPCCTYIFALIVLYTTKEVFWECVVLILETVPPHIKTKSIKRRLMKIAGIEEVHDVHVWALNNDKLCFTTHLAISRDMNGKQ